MAGSIVDILVLSDGLKPKPDAVSVRPGRHRLPHRRRVWHVSPAGFRELRLSVPMSRSACAAFLGCSESAVRAWDRGRNRVPGPVVRLLRLVRLGDLSVLDPAWSGWQLAGDALRSPEGYPYKAGELGWWGLIVRQARMWQQRCDVPQPASIPAQPVCRPEAVNGRGLKAGPSWSKRGRSRRSTRARAAPRAARPARRRLPGLVSFQKQVTRHRGKARKDAACRGDAR